MGEKKNAAVGFGVIAVIIVVIVGVIIAQKLFKIYNFETMIKLKDQITVSLVS